MTKYNLHDAQMAQAQKMHAQAQISETQGGRMNE